MGKITLEIGSSEKGNDKQEKIVLTEEDQKSFFEFIVKLMESKKKITGNVNSNEGLIVCINHEECPMLIITNIEFKPVYSFDQLNKMFTSE
jgi:hypothetical protein